MNTLATCSIAKEELGREEEVVGEVRQEVD
jgi:hypothetical protein